MKSARQNKIIELICSYEIDTQEELVEKLEQIMKDGAAKASAIANRTLEEVKKKIGLEIKY